jgi:hypothetical protein
MASPGRTAGRLMRLLRGCPSNQVVYPHSHLLQVFGLRRRDPVSFLSSACCPPARSITTKQSRRQHSLSPGRAIGAALMVGIALISKF